MSQPRPAPVQFRADNSLTSHLAARADGNSPGWVADRDLTRYYAVLAASLRDVPLTEAEALLLADACNGTLFDASSYRLLWAEIDDAIRHDGLAEKWDVDGADLVRRIRDDWTPAECLAVIDALERAWAAVAAGGALDLRAVGLGPGPG